MVEKIHFICILYSLNLRSNNIDNVTLNLGQWIKIWLFNPFSKSSFVKLLTLTEAIRAIANYFYEETLSHYKWRKEEWPPFFPYLKILISQFPRGFKYPSISALLLTADEQWELRTKENFLLWDRRSNFWISRVKGLTTCERGLFKNALLMNFANYFPRFSRLPQSSTSRMYRFTV